MFDLYAHQKRILAKLPPKIALVHSMGTGKTRTAIEAAKLFNKPLLVICPKALTTNWARELAKWGYEGEYLIQSKETFRRDWNKYEDYPVVVVDECQHFLGTKSQMMRSLSSYFKKWKTPYRWLLSGTVYRSSPTDILILSRLLDKPIKTDWFYATFFAQVRMGARYIWKPRSGIKGKIAELVRALGDVVKMEDCIDMPESVWEEEYFTLTKDQEKAIERLEDTAPIVRYTKIHQICGGTLKKNEFEEEKEPDIVVEYEAEKLDRALEIITEIPRLIVVCRYNNEIVYLKKKIKNKLTRIINGQTKDRDRVLQELKQQNNYCLLVNASCAEGWQLPNCAHMLFYSNSFSLTDKLQMEARIKRIDNPQKCYYKTLIVKDTIDEAVFKSLQNKVDFHVAIYSGEK